jgi:hypothetical protein
MAMEDFPLTIGMARVMTLVTKQVVIIVERQR